MPKKPHLKPNPKTFEFCIVYSNDESFNDNFSIDVFNSVKLSDIIGYMLAYTLGFIFLISCIVFFV